MFPNIPPQKNSVGGLCLPRIRRGATWLTVAMISCVVAAWGCARATEPGSRPQAGADSRKAGTGGETGQLGGADSDAASPVNQKKARPREVVVYFPDPRGVSLQAVRRTVPDDGFPIDTAVRALLNGPDSGEALLPVVPEGTRLLGLAVTGGQAYLNLSREFSEWADGDGLETLFAIVNSLTEFPDVTRVFIMVEGRPLQSYRGLEIAGGMTRRQNLIRRENRVP